MRRIVIILGLACTLALSGCAAGDMLHSLFGAKNSDQADRNRINAKNQGEAALPD